MKKILNWMLAIIFTISCPVFTLAISNGTEKNLITIGCLLSLIFGMFIAIKYIRKIKYNKIKVIISFLVSLYTDKILIGNRSNIFSIIKNNILGKLNLTISDTGILKFLAVFSIPAIFMFVYFIIDKLIPKIREEYKGLTKIEKNFLRFIIVFGFGVSVIIGHYTTAFFLPYSKSNDEIYNYDVIYTSDNGIIYGGDAYTNINHPENDIRQPLFGLCALPFGLIAHFAGELLPFLPNYSSYAISMVTIQMILIGIIIVMLGKILKIDEKNKIMFFSLFLVSAPYLVFSYCLEQYVIALFYVITTIYIWMCRNEEVNYCYIGATGTLVTSGILFPLISKTRKISNWIKNAFMCFIGFLGVTCIGGQFSQFTNYEKIKLLLNNYAGHIELVDKVKQFIVFIKSTIVFPIGQVILDERGFYAYRLIEPERVSKIGVLIIMLLIVSVIINRKEKYTWICFSWVMFSFFILGIIGWGAYENGMFLYSLYFSWAYLGLIFLGVKKVIKNNTIFNILMGFSIIVILCFNIPEIINIFKFAIQYYG